MRNLFKSSLLLRSKVPGRQREKTLDVSVRAIRITIRQRTESLADRILRFEKKRQKCEKIVTTSQRFERILGLRFESQGALKGTELR